MCSKPNQLANGTLVACRKCNDCIGAQVNDWIARSMAEKALTHEVLVLRLSYRNKSDGTLPDAAKAFDYDHIKAFMKRVREAYFNHYGERGEIRYLVAGERGSKFGRVHWHMILFSQKPLSEVGDWQDQWFKSIDKMRLSENIHWQYWDHGHVFIQRPDQKGMAYVLKYVVKDQYNIQNSKGTMREAKSELSGASMFRQSRRPAIGMPWLIAKVADWKARGVIPVSLDLRLPDYDGYWYPKGKFREYLLHNIWEINQTYKEEHKEDMPQWSALTSSLVSDEAALDYLFYGPPLIFSEEERIQYDRQETQKFQKEFARKRAEADKVRQFHDRATKCSSLLTCRPCFDGLTRLEKRAYKYWYEQRIDEEREKDGGPAGRKPGSAKALKRAAAQRLEADGAINPWCNLRASLTRHEKNVARRRKFTEEFSARRKEMFEEARSKHEDTRKRSG